MYWEKWGKKKGGGEALQNWEFTVTRLIKLEGKGQNSEKMGEIEGRQDKSGAQRGGGGGSDRDKQMGGHSENEERGFW